MRKGIIFLILVGTCLLAFFFYLRLWTVPKSPGLVLKESLELANEGKYAEATKNLDTIARMKFEKNPKLIEIFWDLATRERTIKKMEIVDEKVQTNQATIHLEIFFKDGKKASVVEEAQKENGVWKHSLLGTLSGVAGEKKESFEQKKNFLDQLVKNLKLSDQYVTFKLTEIALRLPIGCDWDDESKSVQHPHLGIRIDAQAYPGASQSDISKLAENIWKRPGYKLVAQKDPGIEGVKSTLYEGHFEDPKGNSFHALTLLAQKEKYSVFISAYSPEEEAIVKVVKESLLTVKWTVKDQGDNLHLLHYTILPSEGLKLLRANPDDQSILFSETGSGVPTKPEAVFGVFHIKKALNQDQSQVAFEKVLNKLPSYFSNQKTDSIQPITVNSLKGFEAIGTVFHTIFKVTLVRYTAALHKSEMEWYLFDGTFPVEDKNRFVPKYKEMVRSFQLK